MDRDLSHVVRRVLPPPRSMKDVNSSNFGLLIAYLLPGFVAIVGISFFSETVRAWLTVSPSVAPAVGGFLYVTLGSLAVGLTVSTVRWAVIDTIHHRTGIPKGLWNYAILQEKLSAYQVVVTNQYRYYQWYSNMVVSIAVTFTAFCIATGWPSLWAVSVVVGLETVFWLGSRDTLRNYYCRLALRLSKWTLRYALLRAGCPTEIVVSKSS